MTTPPACSATYELSQVRAATGGDAWKGKAAISADGTTIVAGLRGTARIRTDLVWGRYAQYFDVPDMGQTAEAYDGKAIWAQDISGGVHPYDTPFARERSVTSAYLNRRAYLDPRTSGKVKCTGTHVNDGRAVVLIRVQPPHGVPAELAIDAQTHLIQSVTIRLPLPSDDDTMRYTDYRQVEDLVLPFSISSGTSTAPDDNYQFDVRRYDISRTAGGGDYAKPIAKERARIIGNAGSTTAPMTLEARQLIVWASINGHAAMPFILDTGGHAILTTQAAALLGLRGKGRGASGGSGAGTISTQFAHVKTVRLGDAELFDQTFLVIPYPYSFYERGTKQPLAGILGLEFFERFAIRLDYGNRRIVLSPFRTFRPAKGASPVRLRFEDQEDLPVVEAAADGHPGLFGTDTGNASTLILFGHFLERTGLAAAYRGGQATIGSGTGGHNGGQAETLRRFTLGGRTLHDVSANFTQMSSGSFSSRTEAGNMGFSILSRFIPTFDYNDRILYLERAKRETPFGLNRSGLHVEKNAPGAFDVLVVDSDSAGAAVGIAAGDVITSIDGSQVVNFSWADFTALVGRRAGTIMRLVVDHAGTRRGVTLVLR